MNKLKIAFSKLMADESGQDLIEYALVAALVGLASVAALNGLAAAIGREFTAIEGQFPTAS
jgi:pilus assembly protein Flp/PilA